MRLLITGHRGFIGQYMTRYFNQRGHEVIGFEWGEAFPFDAWGIDRVIHLGAISSTAERNIDKISLQNFKFSVTLIDLCKSRNIPIQIASSASVYGNDCTVFKEDTRVDPRTPYAWSKYMIEQYCDCVSNTHFNPQLFRYFNVYSDEPALEQHKDQPSPHTAFRIQARHTNTITVFENSDLYLRDFVHVHRLCKVQEQFFEIKEGGVWNIGTGKPKSFLQVASQIAAETGANILTKPMPEHLKAGYQTYTCADLTKLNNTLCQI